MIYTIKEIIVVTRKIKNQLRKNCTSFYTIIPKVDDSLNVFNRIDFGIISTYFRRMYTTSDTGLIWYYMYQVK